MTLRVHNREALERRQEAQDRVQADGAALDVRELPSFGFGHRSLMWWGTQGLVLIESTIFLLAVLCWFYLRGQSELWPPDGHAPDWLWGSLNTALLMLSLWPNHLAKQAAERLDLAAVRRWIVVMTLLGVAVLVVRAFEFMHLNTH